MRRDLCYYYPLPLQPVFDAFVQAANVKFGKNCRVDPGKTVSFGLNFSFKYNMNGGSMTLHFMPYQNGTAIDLRYSIVQAMGARYKAHARDFILYINNILHSQGQLIQLDIQHFLSYEAGMPSSLPSAQPQPIQQPQYQQPEPQPVQQPQQPAPQVEQAPVQQPYQQQEQPYQQAPAPEPLQPFPVYQNEPQYQQPEPAAQPAPAPQEPSQPAPAPVRMFCFRCGAKLSENALFCSRCGAKQE